MVNYKRIIKDCFWEYNFTNDELKNLVSGSEREKSFLFQKILLNGRSIFNALKIFKHNALKYIIENYKVSNFNYIFKKKNMIEVYSLNKPLCVNELKWLT